MRTTPRHHHAPTGKEIESAAQSRGRAPTASRPVAAGGCPSLLMAELRQVWRLLIDMQVDLVPVYIPSGDNPADFPSRHSQSAEWTFRAGMRATLSRLSSSAFTLDPFATGTAANVACGVCFWSVEERGVYYPHSNSLSPCSLCTPTPVTTVREREQSHRHNEKQNPGAKT
jgi:hypothetical protein